MRSEQRARLRRHATSSLHRFDESRNAKDLVEGLRQLRDLFDSAPQAERSVAAADLAAALQQRYEVFERAEDLDEAITLLEGAIANDASTRYQVNLANALRLRYELTGDQRDLRDGVAAARASLSAEDLTSPLSVRTARRASNLAILLRLRYERHRETTDIAEAIGLFRAALINALPRYQGARIRSNLAIALSAFGAESADVAIMADALRESLAAVRLAGESDPSLPDLLTNAGLVCLAHATLVENRETLILATQLLKQAADVGTNVPTGEHCRRLLNAAAASRRLALCTDDAHALDSAIRLCEKALESAPWPSDAGALHATLGRALRNRGERTGHKEDLGRAVSERLLTANDSFSHPWERFTSARFAGMWAMNDGDTVSAVAGYRCAIAELPVLAWIGLAPPTRLAHLREVSGTAREGVAVAVSAGNLEAALAFSDHGRNILFQTRLGLAPRGVPESLRQRVETIRTQMQELLAYTDDRVPDEMLPDRQ